MISFLFVVLAALGLGFLVFIHELGHYFMARRVGITVEAFSIGFGRAIKKWDRKGVEWRIGWLPFGGYVKMAGMEKQGDKQPYEVEGGFFNARPIDRIKVALAGPIVNLVFAFLVFCLIWGVGGRDKPYAEFSNRVGWVDQSSPLFKAGLRPGDIIKSYDAHPFASAKDHLYAAMLSGNSVKVKGYHVDYPTRKKTPFRLNVQAYEDPRRADGVKTLGIIQPAQYLIYQPPPIEGSPMATSGIEKGDRLFWADGELIFSEEQLANIVNDGKALLTIKRGDQTLLARVPRVPIRELLLKDEAAGEVTDWHYESDIGGRLNRASFIPYNLSSDGTVEDRIAFFDPDQELKYFPAIPRTDADRPLQVGDKIIAVDGMPMYGGAQIMHALQSHKVNIIVQRLDNGWPIVSWRDANRVFDSGVEWNDLQALTSSIGKATKVRTEGGLTLLRPVAPTTIARLAKLGGPASFIAKQLNEQRDQINAISDPVRRQEALKLLEQQEQRLMFGISLTDRKVAYNPSPAHLFSDVVIETYRTFEALILGYLNPKWLSGPVGIVQVMHYGWSVGFKEALFWLGVISLNLGLLNLLPIPVLDGGHICFSLWEVFTRKKIKAETMEKLIIPFVVLLIAFFIFVTYQDVTRLFKGFF